ncbi:MAG: gfo/Idh/MocA family oxidoreductase, partial [Planctomycetaceae bacterium]
MIRMGNRRDFLRATSGATAGFLILRNSRSARAYTANEKLAVAVVGVGGMGAVNLSLIAGENVQI